MGFASQRFVNAVRGARARPGEFADFVFAYCIA